jgi:molybdenum cofactor guanylyltransferase
MGTDKALLRVGGVAMATRVADALRAVGCTEVVAVGGDPELLEPLGIAVCADLLPGEGPLTGIITSLHLHAGRDDVDVLVAACDLPDLGPDDLRQLVIVADRRRDADVVMAATDRRHPTCALWRDTARGPLHEAFRAGERAVHRAVGGLVVVEASLRADALRNINTLDDLARYPGRHG